MVAFREIRRKVPITGKTIMTHFTNVSNVFCETKHNGFVCTINFWKDGVNRSSSRFVKHAFVVGALEVEQEAMGTSYAYTFDPFKRGDARCYIRNDIDGKTLRCTVPDLE